VTPHITIAATTVSFNCLLFQCYLRLGQATKVNFWELLDHDASEAGWPPCCQTNIVKTPACHNWC